MQATRIIAVRHGETAWNVDTRIQGHLDIPSCNSTGQWQGCQLARTLAGEPPSIIYASDLQCAPMPPARGKAMPRAHPWWPSQVRASAALASWKKATFAEIEARAAREDARAPARPTLPPKAARA